MGHLVDVKVIDRYHSHWVARGPLGVTVEWDAEVINDIPPTLLSWKSVGESDVVSAGSVRFKASGDRGTLVKVKLQYDPPAGKFGATVAWLFGEDPQHQIAEDLRRFKQIVESGESGRRTDHPLSRDTVEPADATGSRYGVQSGFWIVEIVVCDLSSRGSRVRSHALRPGSGP